MQTHVGPPIRCDATQSPGQSAASSFPLAFRLLRFMLPLRSPPWLLSGYWGPPGLLGWTQGSRPSSRSRGMTERSWLVQKIRWFWRCCSKRLIPLKQYDVCYRDWYPCVPTCTAAQLGLHVFARYAERLLWCVQSRVGRFFSGHEHVQALRSWSELQLSQQLLPAEEWGRIHVMLCCHTALIVMINTF